VRENGRRSKNWLAGSRKGADLLGKYSSLLARFIVYIVAQHRLGLDYRLDLLCMG